VQRAVERIFRPATVSDLPREIEIETVPAEVVAADAVSSEALS
jgi:hypothetical protein